MIQLRIQDTMCTPGVRDLRYKLSMCKVAIIAMNIHTIITDKRLEKTMTCFRLT